MKLGIYMKKLLILAIILPLAGCDWFGSDKGIDVVVTPPVVQPDPVTPPVEEPETREEMIERELNLPPEPDKKDNLSILGGGR